MFFHQLAGCLIFFINSLIQGQKPSVSLMIFGAVIASFPDLLYVLQIIKGIIKERKFKVDKNSHEHRDGFCHSIFFPFVFICMYPINKDFALLTFLAVMTHPMIDSWGIGWGVKLFYPFSEKTFKFFLSRKVFDNLHTRGTEKTCRRTWRR